MNLRRVLLFTLLLSLAAAPAHAGPLIGAVGILGAWVTGSISAGAAILGLVVTGAQWLMTQMMQPKEKQRGVKTKMDTGGDNPPAFIVGEYPTAGLLDYANTYGADNHNMVYVIVLSALPVNGISNIVFINGERDTALWGEQDEDGFSYVDEYNKYGEHYVRLKFYDGTQTGADPWLLATFGSDPDRPWIDDMHLDGCAYVIVVSASSRKGVWTANPEFRWVLEGVKVYDPREDTTVGGSGPQRWGQPDTYVFSKNAKVIEYNIVRGFYYKGELVWGGGAEAYRLPLEYWFAAMNVCDENVEQKDGTIINRYEAGGEIHFDDKPIEIIDEINKATCGYTTEYGGVYKTWCGGPGLSVATITDDDFLITEQMTTDRFQPLTAIYNTAYGSYPEPNQQWDTKDSPRFQDADSLAEDGQELSLDIQFPLVSSRNQVQRVLRATVLDSRRQVIHQGQLPPEYFVLETNDRVSFISQFFGYHGDGKDFLFGAKDDLENVNQQVQLREINPDDTGWLKEYEMDSRVAVLTTVKPGALNLDFTLTSVQIDSDVGKDKPAILVEWDWGTIDVDVANIRYEIRLHGTDDIIIEGRIRNIEEGSRKIQDHVLRFGKTYDVRLKAEPVSARDTNWTAWKTVTLVDLDIPSAPTLTPISYLADDGSLNFYLKIDWPSVAAEVTYNLRVVENGDEDHYRADVSHKRVDVTSGKTYTVDVRAIGDNDEKGDWSSPTTITINRKLIAPTAPTSLTADGEHRRVNLATNRSPDKDYKETVFYRSTINDFATASEAFRKTGTRTTDDHLANASPYYYWCTFVDRTGNESAKYPASNTGGIFASTALIKDVDADTTPPSVVAAPSLTLRQNMDGDGVVNSKIKVVWSAPASTVPIKYYEIRVNDGTDTHYHQAQNLSFMIHGVVVGKSYTVDISAISIFGYPSGYAHSTTLLVNRGSTAVPAGGSLSLTALKKRVVIDWPDVDEDSYPAYAITVVYRNTTGTTPVPGTTAPYKKIKAGRFVDEGVVTGTTYTYWIAHRDRSRNYGILSSPVAGASGGNEVSAFADLTGSIATGQIPAGTVSDAQLDQTAPATPGSGPSVTQNPTTANGDGTVDISCKVTAPSVPSGAKLVEIAVDFNYGGTADLRTLHINKNLVAHTPTLIAGKTYAFYYRGLSSAGVPSTGWSPATVFSPAGKSTGPSAPTGLIIGAAAFGFVMGYDPIPIGDADYGHTEVAVAATSSIPPGDDSTIISTVDARGITSAPVAYFFYPIAASVSKFIWARHVNRSGKPSAWVYAGLFTSIGVTSAMIGAGNIVTGAIADANVTNAKIANLAVDTPQINTDAVTSPKMADGAASAYAGASNNTGQAIAASTKTLVQTITADTTNACNWVEVFCSFRNNSGGARTMDVSIEDNAGNVLIAYNGATLADNEYFFCDGAQSLPSGSSVVYRMYVTPTTAANVIRTHMRADSRFR